ncbi:hypothetical protein ACTJJ4_07595 [Microbacterium sp. 22195]|uniref:hypothetical protein n=1 Tax=Microbacterium sp. 22195 TaxID=3453891 RepID=UPI003F82C473
MSRITDAQRAEVLRLHTERKSRNDIARAVGISAGSVTNICREAGLSFDRSATKHATEARQVDLAAARIRLAEKMLHRSERMLDDLDGSYLVYNFGGKDNTYEEHTLDRPPVEVQRNAVVTAGITFDKLTRIVERDAGGSEEAVGMLDTLAEGFKAAAERYRAGEAETDEAR